MRSLVFLFSLIRGELVSVIKAEKFTIGTPSCDTVPSFEYQVSTTCESNYYYEHDESCSITCSEEITMTCECLNTETVITFLKEDGCSWTASATCETSVQSTTVSLTLETSATTMEECEDTATSLESSLSSDLEDEMGTADSLSLTVTCEESTSRKRRSIVRNRRSTTYDANVEIEITSIVEDNSDLVSVVTDTDSIEDLVSETVTTTVEDELSDVVSVPTSGLSVEAEIGTAEVVSQDSVVEIDVTDVTTTTTSTTTTSTTSTTTTTTDSDSTTTTADTTTLSTATTSTTTTTTSTTTTTTTTHVVSYEDIEILENEIEVSF